MRGFLSDLGINKEKVKVSCDNQSTIHLTKHQVLHKRSKHVDVKLYFIREVMESGHVLVVKISTLHNPADMWTKMLNGSKLQHCVDLIREVRC